MPPRRKSPADFTVDIAYKAFRDSSGELAKHIARVREQPLEKLFEVVFPRTKIGRPCIPTKAS